MALLGRACWRWGPRRYLGKDPAVLLTLEPLSHLQPQDAPPPQSPDPSQVPLPELWGQLLGGPEWAHHYPQQPPAPPLPLPTCSPEGRGGHSLCSRLKARRGGKGGVTRGCRQRCANSAGPWACSQGFRLGRFKDQTWRDSVSRG